MGGGSGFDAPGGLGDTARTVARDGQNIDLLLDQVNQTRDLYQTPEEYRQAMQTFTEQLEGSGLLPSLSLIYGEDLIDGGTELSLDQIDQMIESGNLDEVSLAFLEYLRQNYENIRNAVTTDGPNGNDEAITLEDIHAWMGTEAPKTIIRRC